MDQDAAREADEAAALRAIDRERLGEHPAARAQAMARRLVARGAVSTPAVAAAFARVDRRVEIKILRRVRAESSRRRRGGAGRSPLDSVSTPFRRFGATWRSIIGRHRRTG